MWEGGRGRGGRGRIWEEGVDGGGWGEWGRGEVLEGELCGGVGKFEGWERGVGVGRGGEGEGAEGGLKMRWGRLELRGEGGVFCFLQM